MKISTREAINEARCYIPKMDCYPVAELFMTEYQVVFIVGTSVRFFRESVKNLDDAQIILADAEKRFPQNECFIIRVTQYVAKMC